MMVIFLGTHCRRRASRDEAKRVGHGEWGSSESEKMKNRGNEAKKRLKTKDITFLKGAKNARFARKFAQI
jgi:hypothetical protein